MTLLLTWCHRPRRVFCVVKGRRSPFPAILMLWDTSHGREHRDRDSHCYQEPAAKCCRPLGKVLEKMEAFLKMKKMTFKNDIFPEIFPLKKPVLVGLMQVVFWKFWFGLFGFFLCGVNTILRDHTPVPVERPDFMWVFFPLSLCRLGVAITAGQLLVSLRQIFSAGITEVLCIPEVQCAPAQVPRCWGAFR